MSTTAMSNEQDAVLREVSVAVKVMLTTPARTVPLDSPFVCTTLRTPQLSIADCVIAATGRVSWAKHEFAAVSKT